MKTLLCFGDSNTYGYDPRSCLGDRYPADSRWTGLLGPAYTVLEDGQNGREIPRRPWEIDNVRALLDRVGPVDVLTVMLGSNDLLQASSLTAGDVTARMETFLAALLPHPALARGRVLLIAPPPMVPGAWVTEERLPVQSARLAETYRALARRLGISFADAGAWDISLLFDGVHFSPEGHRAFARGLLRALDAPAKP